MAELPVFTNPNSWNASSGCNWNHFSYRRMDRDGRRGTSLPLTNSFNNGDIPVDRKIIETLHRAAWLGPFNL